METATYKIGTNKGKRRIWIDGKRLANAGFIGGTSYYAYVAPGVIVLSLSAIKSRDDTLARMRKVTGRPDGKPIIDMLGGDVALAFPEGDSVYVEFKHGRIEITGFEAGDRPACQIMGGPGHRDTGRGVCAYCGEAI
jgi:hypothetical protein